jgi:Zn-finger nucleic acid-binding protein
LYDPGVDAAPPASTGRGEPMRCPSCSSRLVEVERSEVLIDACPSCRGVWLDRGELDKILVRERELAAGGGADEDFLAEVEGRRRPEPGGYRGGGGYGDSEHGGHGKHGRRKRRGLLEELLDFD